MKGGGVKKYVKNCYKQKGHAYRGNRKKRREISREKPTVRGQKITFLGPNWKERRTGLEKRGVIPGVYRKVRKVGGAKKKRGKEKKETQ